MFTFVFVIEMLIKLLALGGRGYFSVKWNIFDFLIVIISVVEFAVLASAGVCSAGNSGIATVFRAFRLVSSLTPTYNVERYPSLDSDSLQPVQ